MSDDASVATGDMSQAGGVQTVIISDEVRGAFPEIIDLIMQSESMNNGERQYWIDILPSMTPDQVQQLKEILTNERDQLAAIDAKYSQQSQADGTASVEEMGMARTQKRQELNAQESEERTQAESAAEDLLKQIE